MTDIFDDINKIAYAQHPVTPERKQDLRSKGYKIIDIEFCPDELKVKPKSKPKD